MRDRKQIKSEAASFIYNRKNLVCLQFLTYMIAPKIEYLDLSQNFLQNINQFSGCRFSKLKILYLNNNVIEDLNGFNEGYFPVLQKLFLYGNQINNLTPLATIHVPKLLQLKLGFKNNGNNINETTLEQFLHKLQCPLLTDLTLDYNQLNSIYFLQKCNKFDKLTLIYLSGNKIQNIDGSILNQLKSVKILSFRNNYINNLKFMNRLNMLMLEQLNLTDNYIIQINQIYRCQILLLNRLCLKQNLINDISLCLKCNWNKLEQIQLSSVKSMYQKNVLKAINKYFFMIQ